MWTPCLRNERGEMKGVFAKDENCSGSSKKFIEMQRIAYSPFSVMRNSQKKNWNDNEDELSPVSVFNTKKYVIGNR